MKRITYKDAAGRWVIACNKFWNWIENKLPAHLRGEAVDRLAAIEEILGDEYDLDKLKILVKDQKTSKTCDAARLLLNRELWEPCSRCFEELDNDTMRIYYPAHWDDGIGFEYGDAMFCPNCGRPLTDSAWETLEKRFEKK